MEKESVTSYSFFKKLTQLPFVDAIYLFGSRARGVSDEHSDIDLAIVCPQANEYDWLEVVKIIEQADTLLKIDCLRLDALSSKKLKKNILEEKKILYERNSHD
ncbi:MAG: nucleotidyltransferase domain-containing protein [Epsilonproteobacteria bacterium]|nr:nucleotidyltransferase domain-containing protein [Campylobacterota bacterium]